MSRKISFALIFTLVAAVVLIPYISDARKLTTSIKDITTEVEVTTTKPTAVANEPVNDHAALYETLALKSKGLSKQAFQNALNGYNKLNNAGKVRNQKLSIVDFSQHSSKKRLYIIDLKEGKLLFHTLVAHGRNSGEGMAKNFSNTNESNQSSLGFYITAEKYQGKHGLSMRLDGLEKTNSNARPRAIVMHAADYVSESFAKARGYIGRSWGCPAVNPEVNEPIIKAIGNGSVLFIYSPNTDYAKTSSLIQDLASK